MILVSCVDATCRYESELKEETVGSYPWIVYTVLSELIMKIIPALLLVVLNTMIIIKFKKTRISVAKNNQGIEKQRGALTKRNSIYAGVQQRNSYSLAKRRRDQNLINLLFVLYFIFLLTNMPMAVGRIMIGCGIDTKVPPFREFEVVSNTLEVVFAASNFYLYCLCNTQIRTKVDKVFHICAMISYYCRWHHGSGKPSQVLLQEYQQLLKGSNSMMKTQHWTKLLLENWSVRNKYRINLT